MRAAREPEEINPSAAPSCLGRAKRADAMLEASDLDGLAVWRRILRAVEELQRVEPEPGARVH